MVSHLQIKQPIPLTLVKHIAVRVWNYCTQFKYSWRPLWDLSKTNLDYTQS